MRFNFAATVALFGAAIAAPAPQASSTPTSKETVVMGKFKAFHQLVEGVVNEISFTITSHEVAGTSSYACSAVNRSGALAFSPTAFTCNGGVENNQYSFQINEVDTKANTYNLTITHQTTLSGQIKIDTTCRAEGVRSEYCEHPDDLNVDLQASA